MKKFLVALLSLALVISCVCLVACDKSQEILDGFSLPQDGATVNKDFTLPLQIGDKDVEWTSDDAAIALTKGEANWAAKVTPGDTSKVVTLTVKLGEVEKSFYVNVPASDAAIIRGYTLSIADTVVNDNFTLPLKVGGREVTWTSDSAAVVLTKGTDAWNAAITAGEEQQVVNLTVGLGASTKSFVIAVAKLVLSDYILPQDGSYVEKDFTLPLKVLGNEVEWISSDESAIALTKREENGNWLASVTLGSTVKNVTLTVKNGAETKDFTVSVAALDASYFGTKFSFVKDKQTVVDDFALAQETTIAGKTATISWAVKDVESQDFIAISEDGKTCIVTPTSLNPTVYIVATFTYGEQTYEVTYRMTVSIEKSHLELVDYWYNNTGVSVDMSGYIVEIATLYSETYDNISLYMVDDDFSTGYYVYRLTVGGKAVAETLKPGVHITVTGTTNQNYNGLIETNAGGSLKVDTDVAPIDVSEHVYAFDQDLLGNVPAAVYHESIAVSLSNWTVKEVKDKDPDNANTGTLFTLTKGGVDIDVIVSKYMEGAYFGVEQWTAVCAARTAVKEGDVVSVTGVLGYYKKYQIILLSADGVTVGGTADADGTVYAGQTASKAIAAVEEIISENGLDKRVTTNKEVALPATSNGVEITYELLSKSNAVKVEDGKITVVPNKRESVTIQITYEVKDGETVVYSTKTFLMIESLIPTAKTMYEDLKAPATSWKNGTYTLDGDAQYVTWTVDGESELVTIKDNVATVVQGEEDTTVVLIATVNYNNETKSGKFYVKVLKDEAGKKGSETNPYTVEEIIALGATLGDNKVFVYVKGYVVDAGEVQQSGTWAKNVYIADSADETDAAKKFLVYNPNFEKGADDKLIIHKKGDLVVVYGYTFVYTGKDDSKTLEMSNVTLEDNTKVYPFIKVLSSEAEKGTAENPYTAAEALAVAGELKDGEYTDMVYIKGLVVEAGTDKGTFIQNIKLGDTILEADLLLVYSVNKANNIEAVAVGDVIVLKGFLTNYNGTLEVSNKTIDGTKVYPELVSLTTPVAGTEERPYSASEALAAASKLEAGAYTDMVYIIGYVVEAGTDKGTFIQNIKIADKAGEKEASALLLVYSVNKVEGIDAVAAGDLIVLKGFLTNYNGTLEVSNKTVDGTKIYPELISLKAAEKVDVEPVDPEHAGTEADPYTVADALLVAGALEAKAYTEAEVYVKGLVVAVSKYDAEHDSWTFDIADSATGDVLEVFSCAAGDTKTVFLGDTVVLKGYLQKYNDWQGDKLEMTYKGDDAPLFIEVTRGAGKLTVAENENATVTPSKSAGTNGDPITFTVAPAEGYIVKMVSVKTSSVTTVLTATEGVYSTVLGGDTVITVITQAEDFVLTEIVWDFSKIKASGTAYTVDGAKEMLDSADNCSVLGYLTKVEIANMYPGVSSAGNSGLAADGSIKFGSSSKAGQLVLTLEEDVKIAKVVIVCHGWTATDTVAVNSSDAQTPGTKGEANADGVTLEFDLATASNVITIDLTKRVAIYSITLIVETAE